MEQVDRADDQHAEAARDGGVQAPPRDSANGTTSIPSIHPAATNRSKKSAEVLTEIRDKDGEKIISSNRVHQVAGGALVAQATMRALKLAEWSLPLGAATGFDPAATGPFGRRR